MNEVFSFINELNQQIETLPSPARADYHALSDSIQELSQGLWEWDLKSNHITFSPAWKVMLGYQDQEIGHTPIEWLHRIHPDDIYAVRNTLVQHLTGQSPHFDIDHRILHRNGTYCWVRVQGRVSRDPQGELQTMMGSQVDITAARQEDPCVSPPPIPKKNQFQTRPSLSSVFTYIEDHYREPISLRDVAQEVGYSPAYLTTLVQKQTGRTVNQWIIEYRMVEARLLLLKTNYPIHKIAATIGYQSTEHFIRQFRQFHDASPKCWRDSHRSKLMA